MIQTVSGEKSGATPYRRDRATSQGVPEEPTTENSMRALAEDSGWDFRSSSCAVRLAALSRIFASSPSTPSRLASDPNSWRWASAMEMPSMTTSMIRLSPSAERTRHPALIGPSALATWLVISSRKLEPQGKRIINPDLLAELPVCFSLECLVDLSESLSLGHTDPICAKPLLPEPSNMRSCQFRQLSKLKG